MPANGVYEQDVMHSRELYPVGTASRYSAKKMRKPVNFFCAAPKARKVSVVGDFNGWDSGANAMRQGPDGTWHTQVEVHHGHHQYCFLVDGKRVLDPRAQGVARDGLNEPVSVMAVS